MKLDIKVLGTGCAKCKTLEDVTKEVVNHEHIDADISKVEDIMKIMEYGVMSTPALVINNKVAIKGRIPSKDELAKLLNDYAKA